MYGGTGCVAAGEQQQDIHTGCSWHWGCWHMPGHGRTGGAGSPAPQPTREQEHLNPSAVPLPQVREPLLCCATAQGHPETTPGSSTPWSTC